MIKKTESESCPSSCYSAVDEKDSIIDDYSKIDERALWSKLISNFKGFCDDTHDIDACILKCQVFSAIGLHTAAMEELLPNLGYILSMDGEEFHNRRTSIESLWTRYAADVLSKIKKLQGLGERSGYGFYSSDIDTFCKIVRRQFTMHAARFIAMVDHHLDGDISNRNSRLYWLRSIAECYARIGSIHKGAASVQFTRLAVEAYHDVWRFADLCLEENSIGRLLALSGYMQFCMANEIDIENAKSEGIRAFKRAIDNLPTDVNRDSLRLCDSLKDLRLNCIRIERISESSGQER